MSDACFAGSAALLVAPAIETALLDALVSLDFDVVSRAADPADALALMVLNRFDVLVVVADDLVLADLIACIRAVDGPSRHVGVVRVTESDDDVVPVGEDVRFEGKSGAERLALAAAHALAAAMLRKRRSDLT